MVFNFYHITNPYGICNWIRLGAYLIKLAIKTRQVDGEAVS